MIGRILDLSDIIDASDVIGPLLAASLKTGDGRFDLETELEAIATGKTVMFAAIDDEGDVQAIQTASLERYPTGLLVLRLQHTGSRAKGAWREAIDAALAWGRENGAERVEGQGRKGWSRVHPIEGMKPIATVWEAPLG